MVLVRAAAAILLIATTAACAPAAAPTHPQGPDMGAQSKEWDDLVAKGKQEGEIVLLLGGSGSRTLRDALRNFENKFGIKVSASGGGGREAADRILAERQAGIYTVDIWMTGIVTSNTRIIPAGVLDPVKPMLMLPDVLDQSKWYQGRHWYGDPEQDKIFLFGGGPTPDIAVNTQLANANDFHSWYDVLNPKYKGKVVAMDFSLSGVGGTTAEVYTNPELGPNFFKRFASETDVTISRDFRQAAEWLAQGKFAVMVFMGSASTELERLKESGLPVEFVTNPMKEGSSVSVGGSGNISVVNKAPHPNAAKVFVNYWLSREGQIAMEESSTERPSLREDIPHDKIIGYYKRVPGAKYLFYDADPSFQDKIPEALKAADEALKAAGKKQ